MEKRFIYATNRSQIHYRFLIIGENETEYICTDYDVTSDVTFYINKTTLKGRVDNAYKELSFIVNEDWFASLNEEDVKKEENRRQIITIKEILKHQEERLVTLSQLDTEITRKYKSIDFNNLQKGDVLCLLDDDKQPQVAKVIGFITEDKIDYRPLINCENVNAYGVEVEYDKERNEYFINVERDWGYECYHVFKDKEDCNLYLQNKEREKNISNIYGTKNRIAELKQKLKRLEETQE